MKTKHLKNPLIGVLLLVSVLLVGCSEAPEEIGREIIEEYAFDSPDNIMLDTERMTRSIQLFEVVFEEDDAIQELTLVEYPETDEISYILDMRYGYKILIPTDELKAFSKAYTEEYNSTLPLHNESDE